MNLPLNDVFNEIVIKDKTNPFTNAFLMENETREYELNLDEYSVEFRIDILRASNVTESSFGYGLIVYQTKWGISLASLEFRLEWDGQSDTILKDINVDNWKFKLDRDFENKLTAINFENEFNFRKD